MTHPNKLLSTASILALALTLSACSSNSNDNDNSDAMPPADPYKTAIDLTALSGGVETPGSARMKAAEAAEKITPIGSNGDSNAAMMSAQAVLDARTELEDAKASAEKVLEDLPDTPENAAERAMLEEAITAAEDVLDGPLKAQIVKVTGTDEEEPKTAEDTGREVAEKVLAAFDSGVYSSANNTGRVFIGSLPFPPSLDAGETLSGNDHSAVTRMTSSGGQTFGEIFSSDVTDEALGAEGALVPTISIAGEDIDYGIDPTEPDTKFPLGDKIDNSWFGSTDVANGIGGFFQCMGAGCEIKDNKLVGPWVFAPEDPAYHYKKNGDGYTEVPFVEYGHWLEESNDGVRIRVNSRLDSATYLAQEDESWETGEDASATYSGNAAGRSVRQEFATDGEVAASHSGSFTADVDLTATFGASPMLEGRVSGFSAVDNAKAVNTDWEVTLEEAPVEIRSQPQISGVAKGSGEDGVWRAEAYIDEGRSGTGRPDGIYGGFAADFTDGQAVGAFATRKDN